MDTVQTTPKDHVLEILEQLPADSSYDEIIREIAFAKMIERGLADSDAGRTISNEELKRRLEEWRQSGGPTKPSTGS